MSYIYNLIDTWNDAGTTFAGIKMAVTNTASSSSSKLLDLSVSGATTGSFSVDKSGNASLSGVLDVAAGTASLPGISTTGDNNTGVFFPAADTVAISTNGGEKIRVTSTGSLCIGVTSAGGSLDVAGSTSRTRWAMSAATVVQTTTNAAANAYAEYAHEAATHALRIGGIARLFVDGTGVTTVCANTATPANGSTAARLIFGSTAAFGIYYGSGAPTVSAAQGSIYLRSDGNSTSTRLYINTDGSTTWTNVTTAA